MNDIMYQWWEYGLQIECNKSKYSKNQTNTPFDSWERGHLTFHYEVHALLIWDACSQKYFHTFLPFSSFCLPRMPSFTSFGQICHISFHSVWVTSFLKLSMISPTIFLIPFWFHSIFFKLKYHWFTILS